MKIKYLIIILILGFATTNAQRKLTEEYLRDCLPFEIHVSDSLQETLHYFPDKSYKVYLKLYSDPDNHVRIVFRGKNYRPHDYYVMLSSEYQQPDSIFIKVVKDFINCTIDNYDEASKWFEHVVMSGSQFFEKSTTIAKTFKDIILVISRDSPKGTFGVAIAKDKPGPTHK